jgi:putative ABC transport system permease protein
MRTLLAVLRAVTNAKLADSIVGDLEEGRRLRSRRWPFRGRVWFVRSLLAVIAYAALTRALENASHLAEIGDPMGKLSSDLHHAWRSLSAQRGASLAIVLVLALGVGLTSAMFAITDPFVFRPLPYPQADELVVIRVGTGGLTPEAEIPSVADWRGHTNLFRELAASRNGPTVRLRLPERAAALRTMEVTPGFFRVLGLPEPPVEDWEEDAAVLPVVLTKAGEEALSFTDAAVGRVLPHRPAGEEARDSDRETVATPTTPPTPDRNLRVVATTPSELLLPQRGRVGGLTPLDPASPVIGVSLWRSDGRPGVSSSLMVIGRLQTGVTVPAVAAALARPLPSGDLLEVEVEALASHLTSAVRPLAIGALTAGLLILLICAANVANLMMARGAFRNRELLTREALGASRFDLARLVLAELALLTAGAVALGLGLAQATLLAVHGVIPDRYVLLGTPEITARVVTVAALSGLLVMIMGLLPAVFVWRVAGRPSFGQQVATDSRRARALRFGFAAGQSALAMILALGAALLLQSYANLLNQETGFDGSAIVISVSYPPDNGGIALQQDIEASMDRLQRLPGVSASSAGIGPLIDSTGAGMGVRIDGRPAAVSRTTVVPAFFEAAGMTIVHGRNLTAADDGTGIVVNEALVRDHWPGESPIGKLVERGGGALEVVGVVRDAYDRALDAPATPSVFEVLSEPRATSRVNYVLRAAGDPASYLDAARRALADINRDAIIVQVDTLGDRLANSVRDHTFATLILTLFGLAGVSVSVAGLVGIVAFIVARRTREIAIRVAVGAERSHVRRLVTGEALGAAATGTLAGLLVGRWLSAWLESLVYGVEAGNWTTPIATATVLLAVTALAALLPARRAFALEPTEALRTD